MTKVEQARITAWRLKILRWAQDEPRHVAPMAMIFVPSQDGNSHAPQEYAAPAEIANGTDVLLRTLLAIDRGLLGP
jgi:hypothetical protein